MPPLRPRHPEDAVLTSTCVDLDDLDRTSRMGRLLQSHIGARLVQLGYTVKEVNLRNTMTINPGDGEKILSRDLSQITPDQPVQAIMVGTYSITNRTLYITAKLIHPVSRNIISAQSYKLCMDDNLLAMFGLQRQINHQDNGIDPPRESLINKIFYSILTVKVHIATNFGSMIGHNIHHFAISFTKPSIIFKKVSMTIEDRKSVV